MQLEYQFLSNCRCATCSKYLSPLSRSSPIASKLVMEFVHYSSSAIQPAAAIVPPTQLAVIVSSEGVTPLELSVLVVKNGDVWSFCHWLMQPSVTPAEEKWGVMNKHGIDPVRAFNQGIEFDQCLVRAKAFLENSIDPHLTAAGNKVVVFSDAMKPSELRMFEQLNLQWLHPVAVILPAWEERVKMPWYKSILPGVPICVGATHSCYQPDELRLKATYCDRAKAKLIGGPACSTKNVIRLFHALKFNATF